MDHIVETSEGSVAVPSPDHRWTVLFFITEPGIGEVLPELAGCTTGLCSVRDASARLARADARVLGVSAHAPDHLTAFAKERNLGYPLVGDGQLTLGRAVGAPEVRVGDRILFSRSAAILDRSGEVRALLHPIPDPSQHASLVLDELDRLTG